MGIIEHYVFLSEGVHAAELALKIRQQTERDERRLRLMQQEHEKRNSEIAGLQQYPAVSGNGDVQHEQPSTPVQGERSSMHSDRAANEAEPSSKPASPGSAQPSATDTQSPVSSFTLYFDGKNFAVWFDWTLPLTHFIHFNHFAISQISELTNSEAKQVDQVDSHFAIGQFGDLTNSE
ncbi:unnamed protein product [Cylicostephanus goldi]|uniref:Uncharacterized protein n=1 Tax=Cylicostephanus goldi TaxID=71465 RepID=A0A3P7PZP9_CYLGO|nr:unnamed protein product [Cylicostephanus goldi]